MSKDDLHARLRRIEGQIRGITAAGGSDADRKLTEATAAVERLLKS